ncbi:MAG: hypothetical protein HUU15_15880 [Candidatus Brocadiae bacterium]|nr:hypothetical protein [Candidatus Brocadiia bacterium]
MLGKLALLGAASYFLALVIVPILIARMPADYFVDDRPLVSRRHPVLRLLLLALKNLIGLAMIVAGIILIPLPGQGFLTLLLGLTLVNFPGKRSLERKLVAWSPIRRVVQWIRLRAGKPPLVIP